MRAPAAKLDRTTLRTSRLLDFCSRKELIAQTGHQPDAWPLVVLKELVDNALDACEEAEVAPEITIQVHDNGISVTDNGPGIPSETITDVLDFSMRVSSREAYVAPDRGAQGNALKTIVAMPFVLDGDQGVIEVNAGGTRHRIEFTVDPIRQKPVIQHDVGSADQKNGTEIRLEWPDSACSILADAKDRFLQIADDYAWLNPHLSLVIDWFGEQRTIEATDPTWQKWGPSDPTSAHWYTPQHLERLIAGYIAHDQDNGRERTVRELVAEFRGLSGSAKQKKVLDDTSLHRAPLSKLVTETGIDNAVVVTLLTAMQTHSKPVKPPALGVIGKDHLRRRFEAVDCEMESFDYRKVVDTTDGVPWVVETAFGWCPEGESRRLVTGVNWSPGIINPFRELGHFGQSLDTILSQQRADRDEPVILVLHMACPRVEYLDRGKSSVVIES
ncbi:MAG: ATP-binding protein [Alphaproteobacteria bacterium]